MLKKYLAQLDPSLVEILPYGSIQSLATKHGKHYQTISKILRGKGEFSAALEQEVFTSVVTLLEQASQQQQNYLKDLKAALKEEQQLNRVSA